MTRIRHRLADDHRPYVELLDRSAIMSGSDDIAFRRTRIHIKHLRDWFSSRTGWPVVKGRDLFRLVRTPAYLVEGLGLKDMSSPLDYEMLTWVLWYHEHTMTTNFVVSQLAPEIQMQARVQGHNTALDWDRYEHRLSLKRAMRALEGIGAVVCINGDIGEWAKDMTTGNALYEFTPLARQLLVNLPDDLYLKVAVEQRPESLAGTLPGIPPEQRLYRALLLSPAIHALQDEEVFALLRHRDRRQRISQDIAAHLGWELEVAETYACLLRPSASEAGEQGLFPFRRATAHAVLLFCGTIRDRVQESQANPDSEDGLQPDAWDRIRISTSRIESEVSKIAATHGAAWGGYGKQTSKQVAVDVIATMLDWHLLTGPDADGQYYVMPLAARMRGFYRTATDEPEVEESL